MTRYTYKWFSSCHTAEDGKALYKELVKKHHPDNGGDPATMGEINDEFRAWWKDHKDIHQKADGTEYRKESSENIDAFIDILNTLSHIPGLEIDLCGSWLWISGKTYFVKDQLAAAGCHWSRSHKKWFWAADVQKKEGKGHLTEDGITTKYGRQRVNVEYKPILQLQ